MLRFLFIRNVFNHLHQRKNRIFFIFNVYNQWWSAQINVSVDIWQQDFLNPRQMKVELLNLPTSTSLDYSSCHLHSLISLITFFLEESLLLIQYIVNVYKWTKNNIIRKLEIAKIVECFKYKFRSVQFKWKWYNYQKLSFSLIKSPDWHL